MQVALKRLVALEVAVSFLDDDMPLEQQPFEHLLNVERRVVGIVGAERDVLQVEVHRHGRVGVLGIHNRLNPGRPQIPSPHRAKREKNDLVFAHENHVSPTAGFKRRMCLCLNPLIPYKTK